jgi:adenosylmethionine-8-amino-7-oxononanoate aminotransferase
MTSVLYRSPGFNYPIVASASGMRFTDTAGRSYLDMSGGAAVSSLGHRHPQVVEAIRRQLDQFEFAHTMFFTSEPQEALAAALITHFGDPGARAYLTSGGSESNETALKMAWQYWAARGEPGRKIVISREHSYHGNTLGGLSVSGNPGRRQVSAAPVKDWPRISPFYPYREKPSTERLADYAQRVAGELEAAIAAAGPENVAAFICEPVVGASLGVVPAGAGYLEHIRGICDAHGILLILDEIMCGSGRTGTFFAHQQDRVRPDIVTLAKGIAGGHQPLAATIISGPVARVLEENGFSHGHTYLGHPVACAAGMAVQKILFEGGLLDLVPEKGRRFESLLKEILGQHPNVGDIRGRGLFLGIELVSDRETRAGFEPGRVGAEGLRQMAMDEGLICYPGGIQDASGYVPHILLAPPFILEDRHMEECVEKLGRVFKRSLG